MAGTSLAALASVIWLVAAPPPLPPAATAPTPGNITVIGMEPTEIVEWTPLRQTTGNGEPLIVAFAKASTTVGETVLDEVLATKHSIGIYAFREHAARWIPIWEVVTGQMGVAFVEGYDILDVNGDAVDDVCVRIRYYGEGRALDYRVMSLAGGKVQELFEQKSIYHGSVTAATGYIVIEQPVREQTDTRLTTIFALSADGHFQKVREIQNRELP